MMKKIITIAIIAAACMASCGKQEKAHEQAHVLPVRVMQIGNMNGVVERNYVGELTPANTHDLTFPTGGTVVEINVRDGQKVQRGDIIARVDETNARSLYSVAQAKLTQAEDAYQRVKKVYDAGGVNEVKWVDIQTKLEEAKQTASSAKKHLDDCVMRAPEDGIVHLLQDNPGASVMPTTFATVMSMKHMLVEFSIPEQEMREMPIGKRGRVMLPALDNAQSEIEVLEKSHVANPIGHTYKVRAKLIDSNEYLPGMVAKVSFALSADSSIVIPSKCIQLTTEKKTVWVVDEEQHVRRRTITTGAYVSNGVVVTDGLSAGDIIVVEGYQKLFTDASVSIEF